MAGEQYNRVIFSRGRSYLRWMRFPARDSSKANVVDDDSEDVKGVLGIILGALGLIAGLGVLVLVTLQNNAAPALATTAKQDVKQAFAVETKSLGSKQVN